MAKYRRDLDKSDYETLKRNYQDHYDSKESGIFSKSKRHRLLGIKGDGKEDIKNEEDFWYDVRKSVKNGIVDLKLVSDIASVEQQKKMFEFSNKQFSIIDALHSILKTNVKHVVKNTRTTSESRYVYPEHDELTWKSFMAYSLVRIGIEFFLQNYLVKSNLHKRNLDETLDVLKIEMLQFIDKLSDDQKYHINYNSRYIWKDYLASVSKD